MVAISLKKFARRFRRGRVRFSKGYLIRKERAKTIILKGVLGQAVRRPFVARVACQLELLPRVFLLEQYLC